MGKIMGKKMEASVGGGNSVDYPRLSNIQRTREVDSISDTMRAAAFKTGLSSSMQRESGVGRIGSGLGDEAVSGSLPVAAGRIKQVDSERCGLNITGGMVPEFDMNMRTCNICRMTFRSRDELISHLKSDKHAKSMEVEYSVDAVKDQEKEKSGGVFRCETCKITLATKQSLQRHFGTKKHIRLCDAEKGRRGGEEKEELFVFKCSVCNLQCTSEESLKNHFAGKHLNTDSKSASKGGAVKSFWQLAYGSDSSSGEDDEGNLGTADKRMEKKDGTAVDGEPEFDLDKKTCNVCKATFGEKSNLVEHLKTEEHFKRMSEAWVEDTDAKSKDKEKQKKGDLNKKNGKGDIRGESAETEDLLKDVEGEGSFWCELCKVRCFSEKILRSHFETGMHLHAVIDNEERKDRERLAKICGRRISGPGQSDSDK